jgi:hypothetical protein
MKVKSHSRNGKLKGAKEDKLQTAAFSNFANDLPLRIDQICNSLYALAGGWPKCISDVLCYVDASNEVRILKNAAALFAWIGSQAPVEWKRSARAVTKEEFFNRLQQRERWAWATRHPHFPPVEGVLYLASPPEAANNGMLGELVKRFRPETAKDRELIKALVLTLFWGGPPGKRPQFVIAADEANDPEAGRGTGKTSLAQYLAELVGGCIDLDLHDRGHILTNLLSPTAWGQRIVLLDNLKTLHFSDETLEKLITRTEITGHRLFSGFGTRPNLLTWVVTINGANFSTDMAQRSVVIRLKPRPKSWTANQQSTWDEETQQFITDHREEIIANVRWHLEEMEPNSLTKLDRWGPWDRAVLSRCANPSKLLSEISKRREGVDADKSELEIALDHLIASMARYFEEEEDLTSGYNLDSHVVWAPTAWLVQALRILRRDFSSRQAQHFLVRLTGSPHFKQHRHNSQRGFRWVGKNVADPESAPVNVIHYRPSIPSER